MSKASVTSVIVLCAALAACTDGTTSRTLTGPEARGDLGEAPAEIGFAYTLDGPLDGGLASEVASVHAASAAQRTMTLVTLAFDMMRLRVVWGIAVRQVGLDRRRRVAVLEEPPRPEAAPASVMSARASS